MARIIIADDDPILRELVRRTLEGAGHIVGTVEDGDTAAAVIAFKRPDLAILDVSMPGCSGIDVVLKVRNCAHAHKIPLIMLTARSGKSDADIAYRAGADDFLSKPLDPDLLLACVDRQLHGRKRHYG